MREDADIQQALTGAVLYPVEAEQDDPELAESYQVTGYPTYVLLDASGKTVDRWSGYAKDAFIATLSAALTDLTPIDDKQARFAARPTARDAGVLARYHDSRGEYEAAVTLYQRAQALDPAADYAMEIFDATFYGTRKHAGFTLDDTRAAADAVLASSRTSALDALGVADMMAAAALDAGQPELMQPYIEAGLARTRDSDDARVGARRARLAPLHALYVEHDAQRAVALEKQSMPAGWREDASALNAFAWWCFQNGVDTEEALALALDGVERAQPGKARAMILDTAAELCNRLDDCRQAVDLMQRAIADDPRSDHYPQQLERFQERLAQRR